MSFLFLVISNSEELAYLCGQGVGIFGVIGGIYLVYKYAFKSSNQKKDQLKCFGEFKKTKECVECPYMKKCIDFKNGK